MTGLDGTYRLVEGILRDSDGAEISHRPSHQRLGSAAPGIHTTCMTCTDLLR